MNLEKALHLINDEIDTYPFGKQPIELYEPLRYIMALGGKRIRPILTLLGYNLYQPDFESVVSPSLAVEVFHNFTLMHDDIMDNAPLRRGEATVHEKWNTNIAILSGDVMLIKAYDLLLTSKGNLANIFHDFNECARLVCEGQQMDMNFETRDHVSVEEYIEMIKLKTSVLLGHSLRFGAMMGGASPWDIENLYNFGCYIGIGFQLKDDLLDVFGEQAKVGKQVGGDIISNKKTYLLIRALQKADSESKATLDQWLKAENFNKEEKVKAVTDIYNKLHIKEETEKIMHEYFERAFEYLDAVQANQESKTLLKSFAKNLIEREK